MISLAVVAVSPAGGRCLVLSVKLWWEETFLDCPEPDKDFSSTKSALEVFFFVLSPLGLPDLEQHKIRRY
jgi:hypothetical protein